MAGFELGDLGTSKKKPGVMAGFFGTQWILWLLLVQLCTSVVDLYHFEGHCSPVYFLRVIFLCLQKPIHIFSYYTTQLVMIIGHWV